MRLQRPVGVLLALAILLGTLPASLLLAETPEADEAPRTLEESFRFDYGRLALLPGTPRQRDAQYTVSLNRDIDAQKAMLTELHMRRQLALALFDDPDQDCERQELERHYQAEMQTLRDQIAAIRDLRGGDRRKLFTRLGDSIGRDIRTAWHQIGPLGRKIMRELGNEAVIIVSSGGTLHGGAARRLLFAVGRRHAPELLLRAVTRRARQADAQAIAGAKAACGVDELAATPSPDAGTTPGSGASGLAFDSVCGVGPEAIAASGQVVAPPPPYEEPAVLVYLDWLEKADVQINYGLVQDAAMYQDREAVKDPGEAAVSAGCGAGTFDAGGIDGCWPGIPLVLTEAQYPGAWNWAQSPGAYSLVVQASGACWFRAGDDEVDWDRVHEVESRAGELEVTATVAYYHADQQEPYRVDPPISLSMPRGPTSQEANDAEGPIDLAPYRRVIELLDWDPSDMAEGGAK